MPYKDDAYKDTHSEYYIREINEDLDWYGWVYSDMKNKFHIEGRNADETAEEIIRRLELKEH